MGPNCSNTNCAAAGVNHVAKSTPAAVPIATSASASRMRCLTTATGRAPIATRTASSRARSIERTTSSPIRLKNAISVAIAAAAASNSNVALDPRPIAVVMGMTIARDAGVARAPTWSSAVASDAGVTPGASRANARMRNDVRAACAAVNGSGRQIGSVSAKRKLSGRMPMIW